MNILIGNNGNKIIVIEDPHVLQNYSVEAYRKKYYNKNYNRTQIQYGYIFSKNGIVFFKSDYWFFMQHRIDDNKINVFDAYGEWTYSLFVNDDLIIDIKKATKKIEFMVKRDNAIRRRFGWVI